MQVDIPLAHASGDTTAHYTSLVDEPFWCRMLW